MDDKGFFVPTIMVFIFIFTIFIAIIVMEKNSYSSINNMYLSQVYEESARIYFLNDIKKYKNFEYEDLCKEKSKTVNHKNWNLKVSPYCFFEYEDKYQKILKEIFPNKKLEFSKEEYNQKINSLELLNKEQKILSNKIIKKINSFIEKSLEDTPEGKIAVKIIKMKVKENLKKNIAFDIRIKVGEKENFYLYIYNVQKNTLKRVYHT